MAKNKKITFNPFDISSVERAYNEIVLYESKFRKKLSEFSKRLAEYGVTVAQTKLLGYNAVFTAELLESLHVELKKDGVYAVVSHCNHTAFVEFGTGQLGSAKPYPYGFMFPEKLDWEYNMGETIQYAEEDLYYGDQVIPQGTYYWFYYNDRMGRWYVTQGMPSRPFMSETALDMAKLTTIRRIAKEVFK